MTKQIGVFNLLKINLIQDYKITLYYGTLDQEAKAT
jgi:hypothetical protein